MPRNQNHLVSDATLIQVAVREEKASLLMLHCFGCVQIYFLQKDDSDEDYKTRISKSDNEK